MSTESLRRNTAQVVLAALVLVLLACLSCGPLRGEAPAVDSITLANGLRIVAVHIGGSTNVAIFTFLPMGLAFDGPGQSQWSHLVEHLVIRSTVPADSAQANAETLPDHMRLDWYGSVDNWQTGLKHQADWLTGIPFTTENLLAEKPRVNSECDFTARNFATHKFAMAAWNQGYRHGRTNAPLKGDIARATLEEIQKYRNERLVVLDRAVVCVVGGVKPAQVLTAFSRRLESAAAAAKVPPRVNTQTVNRDMTWDLAARHLVLTWPIPATDQDDYAALIVAGQWLTMQFFADPKLKQQTGMVLAGADLATPEGNFFYVSASLRPEASFQEVRDAIEQPLQKLREGKGALAEVAMLGNQLSQGMTVLPDPASLKGQLPPNVTLAMLEMNLGLQWGMNEFHYGRHKSALARKLAAVDAKQVQQAAANYLAAAKCSAFTLRPSQEAASRAQTPARGLAAPSAPHLFSAVAQTF